MCSLRLILRHLRDGCLLYGFTWFVWFVSSKWNSINKKARKSEFHFLSPDVLKSPSFLTVVNISWHWRWHKHDSGCAGKIWIGVFSVALCDVWCNLSSNWVIPDSPVKTVRAKSLVGFWQALRLRLRPWAHRHACIHRPLFKIELNSVLPE